MRKELTNANPTNESKPNPSAAVLLHLNAAVDRGTTSAHPVVENVIMQPLEPITVTTETAALLLGISGRSLLDSCCSRIPYGNKYLFEPAALRAFIASLRVDPCSFDATGQ